tara:strand:- start:162 stop:290 length:129 start_codon:yes stop_codon:yes gene_type:complete
MDKAQNIIIYLDIFAFFALIAFFMILFKSNSFFKGNKKDEKI